RYIYIGDAATYEIGQYNRTGTLQRIFRRQSKARSVSAADRASVQQTMEDLLLSVDGPMRQNALRAAEKEQEVWKWYPHFQQLLTDSEDRLWVLERIGINERHQRWAVFDSSGSHLADVLLPVGNQRVLSIRNGHVVTLDGPPAISAAPQVRAYPLPRLDE